MQREVDGKLGTQSSAIDGREAQAITQDENTTRRGRQALARLIRLHGGKVQEGGRAPDERSERTGARSAGDPGAMGEEERRAQRNIRR